jgi:hypothetical protein
MFGKYCCIELRIDIYRIIVIVMVVVLFGPPCEALSSVWCYITKTRRREELEEKMILEVRSFP